jgi:hypothetical protein
VIGIVGPDGVVGALRPPLPVDRNFVQQAGPRSESRFRFAEPCAGSRCGHWLADDDDAGRCGLIDGLLEDQAPAAEHLPACGIRRTCRWFAQRGPHACAVCPHVTRTGPAASDSRRSPTSR